MTRKPAPALPPPSGAVSFNITAYIGLVLVVALLARLATGVGYAGGCG